MTETMHNKIAQWWGGGKERLGNQVEIKRKQKRQGGITRLQFNKKDLGLCLNSYHTLIITVLEQI